MATINDVVLIYLEDKPVSFARVESILPDHKKDWYQIKLLMLQIPLQVVTWILKDAYINGDDFFMNGKKMRMDVVECPGPELESLSPEQTEQKDEPPAESEQKPDNTSDTQETGGNIISFAALRNNKKEDPEPGIG
ncbi:MAG TPA: hypothetical protein DHV36_13180 [Desulfobacteraceae bacterium]|nr:hypothetical protein [Desulfobacteraceae bacterium]|tara:strand:+ start:659 stop:1066 length:408 start_codon:yes stop_codon:yes gene_type:complete